MRKQLFSKALLQAVGEPDVTIDLGPEATKMRNKIQFNNDKQYIVLAKFNKKDDKWSIR